MAQASVDGCFPGNATASTEMPRETTTRSGVGTYCTGSPARCPGSSSPRSAANCCRPCSSCTRTGHSHQGRCEAARPVLVLPTFSSLTSPMNGLRRRPLWSVLYHVSRVSEQQVVRRHRACAQSKENAPAARRRRALAHSGWRTCRRSRGPIGDSRLRQRPMPATPGRWNEARRTRVGNYEPSNDWHSPHIPLENEQAPAVAPGLSPSKCVLQTSSTASCCLLRTSTISFGVSHAFFTVASSAVVAIHRRTRARLPALYHNHRVLKR